MKFISTVALSILMGLSLAGTASAEESISDR